MPRSLYLVLGWIFVGLGFIGAFLPILPTVPFLIAAAACFSRGSDRAYRWLMELPVYGPALRKWRDERTIPRRAKIVATALIVVSFGLSIAFFVPVLIGKVAMGGIGLSVIVFIWLQKSR
jgi:uncharacterized membrane protein YbaN (DUF454 family)